MARVDASARIGLPFGHIVQSCACSVSVRVAPVAFVIRAVSTLQRLGSCHGSEVHSRGNTMDSCCNCIKEGFAMFRRCGVRWDRCFSYINLDACVMLGLASKQLHPRNLEAQS